jgi:hypothetical protein
MSIDFFVQVVIGVPIVIEQVKSIQTKYNEDTGKPYSIKKYRDKHRLYDVIFDSFEKLEKWCDKHDLDLVEVGGDSYIGIDRDILDIKSGTDTFYIGCKLFYQDINTVYEVLKEHCAFVNREDIELVVHGFIL